MLPSVRQLSCHARLVRLLPQLPGCLEAFEGGNESRGPCSAAVRLRARELPGMGGRVDQAVPGLPGLFFCAGAPGGAGRDSRDECQVGGTGFRACAHSLERPCHGCGVISSSSCGTSRGTTPSGPDCSAGRYRGRAWAAGWPGRRAAAGAIASAPPAAWCSRPGRTSRTWGT